MLNQRVVYNALRSSFQRKLIEMWSDEFVIVIRIRAGAPRVVDQIEGAARGRAANA